MPKPEVSEAEVRGAYECILALMRSIRLLTFHLRPTLSPGAILPADPEGETVEEMPEETWGERREWIGLTIPGIMEDSDRLVYDFPTPEIMRLAEVVYPAGAEPVQLIDPTTTVIRAMVDEVRHRVIRNTFRAGGGPFLPMVSGDIAATREARSEARKRSTPAERMAATEAAWLAMSDDQTERAVRSLSRLNDCDWTRAAILARREGRAILERIASDPDDLPEAIEPPEVRKPSKDAIRCWARHRLQGLKQIAIAEEMGWGRTGQGKVSRYCRQVEDFLGDLNMIAPTRGFAEPVRILDPRSLERFTDDDDDE